MDELKDSKLHVNAEKLQYFLVINYICVYFEDYYSAFALISIPLS